METFLALAGGSLPFPEGCQLHLHSHFSQAINFVTASGSLFTFHRYGKGCSPAGWLFRRDEFDEISDCVTASDAITTRENRLTFPKFHVQSRRILNFTAPQGDLALPDLSTCTQLTGLLGPLNQAINALHHPVIERLTHGLDIWYAGGIPDWSELIGLGPGLTPSGDDMLIGAMAALHTHPSMRRINRYHLFLPALHSVALMTTTISCCYLENAAQGYFPTPLLRLLRRLNQAGDTRQAIQALLLHGHTSGADTLIGLITTLRWLKKVDAGKRHA